MPELKQIEETLPEQSVQLQERAKRAKTLASDPASLVALEEELRSWELAREQLSTSLTLLTERLTDLEAALEDISQQREVWKVTEQAALQAVAPDSVVARIRDVRQTLRDAKRSVEGRRDELLALQARVAEEEQRARAALDSLSEARSSFRSLLFLRDSRPLWAAFRAEHEEVAPGLTETLAARWRSLGRFAEARRERLLVHLALAVLALAATFALRRRASEWRADDPRLARDDRVGRASPLGMEDGEPLARKRHFLRIGDGSAVEDEDDSGALRTMESDETADELELVLGIAVPAGGEAAEKVVPVDQVGHGEAQVGEHSASFREASSRRA